MSRRIEFLGRNWVGRATVVGVMLTAVLVALPALLDLQPLWQAEEEPSATLTPLVSAEETEQYTAPDAPSDSGQTISLLRSDGTTETLTLEDYLFGVVSAEMPASFQLEALKAQAVAARTYTTTRQQDAVHPDGTLCDDSSCCQAYVDVADLAVQWGENFDFYCDKIQTAVAATDGLMIYYQGEPIEALFFAAAAGRTVDAVDVWGNQVDYLVGVNSPEGDSEVPNYYSQVTLTKTEVETLITQAYPEAELGSDTDSWLQNATHTQSGSVSTLEVGGLTLTGSEVRTLFSLRSATFSYHWEGNSLIFNVTGYGHGVGMSQYGANTLAAQGYDFLEILAWYYTGTTVE